MIEQILKAALDVVEARTDRDGWAEMPEGRTMTLYAARDGVPLHVTKVEAIKTASGLLQARSLKGEMFVLALKDVFAAAVDGGGKPGHGRKTGFLG